MKSKDKKSVTLTWKKAGAATQYYVYVKAGKEKFQPALMVKDGVSYVYDTEKETYVKSGKVKVSGNNMRFQFTGINFQKYSKYQYKVMAATEYQGSLGDRKLFSSCYREEIRLTGWAEKMAQRNTAPFLYQKKRRRRIERLSSAAYPVYKDFMNENAIESVESLSLNVWISAPGEDVTPIVDWDQVSIPIGESLRQNKKGLAHPGSRRL